MRSCLSRGKIVIYMAHPAIDSIIVLTLARGDSNDKRSANIP